MIPENSLPVREGFSAASKEDKGPVKSVALRVGAAKSLKELDRDYGFFTPALLYMRLRLRGVDPLHGFLRECPSATPFTLSFNQPVFAGLELPGNKFWNHHLMAIERQHWDSLMQWAVSLTLSDPELGLVARVRPMMVRIVDPLFASRNPFLSAPPPMVEVGAFALDTNRGCVWIEEDAKQPFLPPRVVNTNDVFRDTGVLANAITAGDANPFRKVEEDSLDPALGLTPSEAWLIKQYGDREPAKETGRVGFDTLPADEQRQIVDLAKFYNQSQGR